MSNYSTSTVTPSPAGEGVPGHKDPPTGANRPSVLGSFRVLFYVRQRYTFGVLFYLRQQGPDESPHELNAVRVRAML